MSNILKKPSVSGQKGRNGFDMSRSRSFTCTAGQLLPIFKDFANPGDQYKLDSYTMLRTEAMQTAAMMHLDVHVDHFFVPITQLMNEGSWNAFFNGTNDVMSSIFIHQGSTNAVNATFGTLPLQRLEKILRHFEFMSDSTIATYYDTPRTTFFGTLVNQNNTDYYRLSVDEFGIPYAWNFRRLWDMLGYGSVDKYTVETDIPLKFSLLDFLAYHKIFHSHYRMTDWTPNDPTIYNIDDLLNVNSTTSSSAFMSRDRLMKLVSTIHYNRYSKDYFTNIMPQPLFSSEFASFMGNTFNQAGYDNRSNVNPELTVGYPNYKNGNSLGVQYPSAPQYPNLIASPEIYNTSTFSSISASDVRAVFALDKLLRVTAFAGGHYDDQISAHFGFNIPKGISNEAYYLGSQQVPIDINEVVATATTGFEENGVAAAGSAIGDIAGKAFAPSEQKGNSISFTAPCHGIIMSIFSVVPKPEYASMGCETVNRYQNSLDFYHPELDNVGMQPMYGVFNGVSDITNANALNGWTYRWAELKSTFDVINEGFWNTSKETWVGYKQSIYPDSEQNAGANYFRQFYCMPQYTNTIFALPVPFFDNTKPFAVPAPPESDDYKLTNIYEVPALVDDPSWNIAPLRAQDVYESDNFLVKCYIKCYKTSIMSVHSLPKMR